MPNLTPAYLETVFTVTGYLVIITIGQYVSMSSGILSTATAAWAGVGAYSGGMLSIKSGLPLPLAMVFGFAVTAVIGMGLGYLTVKVAPLVAGLMTLGFAESLIVIADNIHSIGGANGLSDVPIETNLKVTLATLAVIVFVGWRYDNSRLGLAARATRDDGVAARAMGVRIGWVKSATFALGAGIAGIGGVLEVHYVSFQAPGDMGFVQGTNYLLFAVFGGSYTVWGAVAGAAVLNLLPEFLRFTITDRYILYGLLLAVMVILRPDGLISRRTLVVVRFWFGQLGKRIRPARFANDGPHSPTDRLTATADQTHNPP
jgi:branched-chain amino acid transport system permease protein